MSHSCACRVQYIQEVILPTPSLFEENLMSALNSFILFNKTEIINIIQEDHAFLGQLFDELCSDSTPDRKYQRLVALLKEVCMFSLALEAADRTKLFLKMNCYGFMSAIEGMLVSRLLGTTPHEIPTCLYIYSGPSHIRTSFIRTP